MLAYRGALRTSSIILWAQYFDRKTWTWSGTAWAVKLFVVLRFLAALLIPSQTHKETVRQIRARPLPSTSLPVHVTLQLITTSINRPNFIEIGREIWDKRVETHLYPIPLTMKVTKSIFTKLTIFGQFVCVCVCVCVCVQIPLMPNLIKIRQMFQHVMPGRSRPSVRTWSALTTSFDFTS
jgi:hypothetical protein